MKTVLEAKNICKTFEDTKVDILKDINLTIGEGEFVSLMGQSGSGKSTLPYLLGGLDKATSGQILINGTNISTLSDSKLSQLRRQEIGFVFQFYNLIQNMTVEDNILLPILMRKEKVSNYRKQMYDLLETCNLKDKLRKYPHQLSGGEQQRVSIIRSLIINPSIIFADEATGNLDSKSGIQVMNLFSELQKTRGVSILHVTHSDKIAQYSDRIIELKDGRIYSERSV